MTLLIAVMMTMAKTNVGAMVKKQTLLLMTVFVEQPLAVQGLN